MQPIDVFRAIKLRSENVSPRSLIWNASEYPDAPLKELICTPGRLEQLLTVACVLIHPDSSRGREFLRHIMPDPLAPTGIPLDWATLFAARWTAFPIVRTYLHDNKKTACLNWCLLGGAEAKAFETCWPKWWESVAASDSLEACRLSLRLAEEDTGWSFCLWPLLPPLGSGTRVTGQSLGLPIYLHAKALAMELQGRDTPLLATGGVALDRTVADVGDLTEKLECASREKPHGIEGLLAPKYGECRFESHTLPLLARVSTLEEAWTIFEWSLKIVESPEVPHSLQVRAQARNDLEGFFTLGSHPLWYLKSVHESGHLEKVKEKFFNEATGEKISRFCQILNEERSGGGSRVTDERHKLLIGDVKPCDVERFFLKHPVESFGLCMEIEKYYSHDGSHERECEWHCLAEKYLPHVWSQTGTDGLLQAYVTGWLNICTNRFDFATEMSPSCEEASGHIVEAAKRRMAHAPVGGALYYKEAGKIVNTVGCRYGYMGRHDDAIQKFQLALLLLGQEINHARRVRLCMAFTYLEADDKEKAFEQICLLLGSTPEEVEFENLDQYSRHVLSRYYKKYPEPGKFSDYCVRYVRNLEETNGLPHPQFLTLHNIGHLLEDRELRAKAWRCSAKEASAGESSTVLPMALLPLAALHQGNLAELDWLREETESIVWRIRTSKLHLDHFRPLLEAKDSMKVLEFVHANQETLFPFDFR